MSCAIHLYHAGDRLRASLTRDLVRAGMAVEAFATPDALLAAAQLHRPGAILWDVDAAPAAQAEAIGAPLVLLTRSRETGAAHPEGETVVLPFERWRLAPVAAALAGLSAAGSPPLRVGAGGPFRGANGIVSVGPLRSPRLPPADFVDLRDQLRPPGPDLPLQASGGRAPVPPPAPEHLAAAPHRGGHPRLQTDTVREARPSTWVTDDFDDVTGPAPSHVTPLPHDAPAPRVLIADDDEVLQHILGYQLGAAGWEVVRAADGVAAQVALQAGDFDLVLIDLNLPHVNAFELLEELDLRHSDRKEQVVVMSEQAQDDKVIRAFNLGAHDFLPKPLNPQVALSRFRRLLERA